MIANVPDVHQFDREIPAGKVLVAEYRDVGDARRVSYEVLDKRAAWNGRRTAELYAMTAGFASAGSMMRWDNGCYGVRWEMDGATYGARYRTFDDALAHFNRLPD